MQTFRPPIVETRYIGENDRYPSHLLPPGLFTKVQNGLIDNNILSKRPGNTQTAASLGSQIILGGSGFEPAGGTKVQIVCRNGASNSQLYRWTGSGTWAAIGSANLTVDVQMNFVQASNTLLGFNGTDVVDYDGTTVTKNRSGIPLGKFGAWFHNYLFVAGVTASPNRLYWSDLGAPITFTAANFIDINANDGDSITGLASFNDELFIFKNNTIWSITGWSGSTFSATTIAGQNTNSKIYGYGTPSHQSIIATGKNLYYLSFVGGVPHFRDLGITIFAKTIDQGIVSWDIDITMNGLNKAQLVKAAGIYDGKRIRWAVPNGSSTTNNLVLVFKPEIQVESKLGIHRSWVRASGITPSQWWHSTISGRDKIYYGDATTGGIVFEADTSVFTDNGTNVELDARSRDFYLDLARKAKWKYMYLKTKRGTGGSLIVKARIDQAEAFATQDTIDLQGSSPGLGPTGTFTLGTSTLGGASVTKDRVTFAHLTGSIMGLQFSETTSSACDIYDYEIYGQLKGLRDE